MSPDSNLSLARSLREKSRRHRRLAISPKLARDQPLRKNLQNCANELLKTRISQSGQPLKRVKCDAASRIKCRAEWWSEERLARQRASGWALAVLIGTIIAAALAGNASAAGQGLSDRIAHCERTEDSAARV